MQTCIVFAYFITSSVLSTAASTAKTLENLPEISSVAALDSSLFHDQRKVISSNYTYALIMTTSLRRQSFWMSWRSFTSLVALEQLKGVYEKFSGWQDKKTAFFEEVIRESVVEFKSDKEQASAVSAFNRFTEDNIDAIVPMSHAEVFYRVILCEFLQDAGSFRNHSTTIVAMGLNDARELYRRSAFCENTFSNADYGLSPSAVQLLDSLDPGSLPLIVEHKKVPYSFALDRRDYLVSGLFEYLASLYTSVNSFQIKLSDGAQLPANFLRNGMRVSTLYLIAYQRNTGYLYIVAEE